MQSAQSFNAFVSDMGLPHKLLAKMQALVWFDHEHSESCVM
jgi:hypothetical protein